MYKVFYGNKVITFTVNSEACPAGSVAIRPSETGFGMVGEVLRALDRSDSVCVAGEGARGTFEEFLMQFTPVEAAGGLVVNPQGRMLMISRNGRWDLPKGHREQGETLADCAVREVSEETGLRSITLGEKITETMHFYRLDGRWEMKTTHWYAMTADGDEFTPQREEGITGVRWIDPVEIGRYLDESYSSIREVFRQYEAGISSAFLPK